MRLGIRLHDTAVMPIEERLKNVKANGFECVHIALSKTDGLPSDTKALTPGYGMYLKRIFDEAGVDVAVLGNYQNLANPNEEKLKAIKERYRAHLKLAAVMGCGMVGTETGAPNEDYRYDKTENRSQRALDIFVENLSSVVEDAQKLGVLIAIEPVYKHIVYDARRAREVLDRIKSPNLRIIFDPVNLVDPEELDRRDYVIDEAMELLSDEIDMIHLKDYIMEGDSMKCVGCGFGQMDYSRIVKFANEMKPYIHATLENTTPETARESLMFIRRLEEEMR
ncbi:MAG: sugar phosphate isomerase/epimerase [Clostridiales bacterium]|nr:sugar phosphate isomerase/epimerase [Clostridiales bacterium]